jgi:hypothetical protein
VTPLTLDVTSVSQVQRAVEEVDTLEVLVIKTLTRGGTYLLTVGSDNIAATGAPMSLFANDENEREGLHVAVTSSGRVCNNGRHG